MAIQKKKFYQKMQPLNQRISKVHHFLEKIKKGLVYEIAPIQDAYGPTRTDAHIQALIGSTETQAGCEAVNDMRKTQALPSLDIFLIRPLILEHQSVKLSSSKIREYLDKKEMSVFFT
jgi:phosphopantetheine adenylyltransferase